MRHSRYISVGRIVTSEESCHLNTANDSPLESAPSPASDGMNARSASGVGIASAVAAAAGIVILLITSHHLTPADNAEFMSFWAALFFVCGVLGGIQTEATRAIGAARLKPVPPGGSRVRVIFAGLIVGALAALAILLLSPLLGAFVFRDNAGLITAALVVTAIVFSCHSTLAGALQGSHQWPIFARLVSLEALTRLAAIAIAALLAAPLIGVELSCLVALSAWIIVVLFSKRARTALVSRADVGLPTLLRHMWHALLSAASSSALIVAFPILVKLTTSEAEYAVSAPLLLAISLTRAPIMVPLQAFQGLALTQVLRNRESGWTALRKPIGLLLLIGTAGAVVAGLLGPYIMPIFGPQYHVDGLVLSLLTFAAVLMAVLTLLGTAVIALGYHRAYSAGWVTATIVAILLLLLPLPVDMRCVLSLTVGPLVGVLVHASALGLLGRPARPKTP